MYLYAALVLALAQRGVYMGLFSFICHASVEWTGLLFKAAEGLHYRFVNAPLNCIMYCRRLRLMRSTL